MDLTPTILVFGILCSTRLDNAQAAPLRCRLWKAQKDDKLLQVTETTD